MRKNPVRETVNVISCYYTGIEENEERQRKEKRLQRRLRKRENRKKKKLTKYYGSRVAYSAPVTVHQRMQWQQLQSGKAPTAQREVFGTGSK